MVEVQGSWTATIGPGHDWVPDEQIPGEKPAGAYPSAHIEVDADERSLRIWQEGRDREFTIHVTPDHWAHFYGDQRLDVQYRTSAGDDVTVTLCPSDETNEQETRQMIAEFLQLFKALGGRTY